MAAATPRIFVISLRDSARRGRIAENLDSLGLDFEFFDAVDGRRGMPALQDNERMLPFEGDYLMRRPLEPTELSCYLSHLRLMRHCLALGLDRALVLEDDVRCGPDVPALLAELSALAQSVELVRLRQFRTGVGSKAVAPLLGGRRWLCRPRRMVLETTAYLISRAGLERMAPALEGIRYPVDLALDRFWVHGLRMFSVLPPPVGLDARSESVLATGREAAERGVHEESARQRRSSASRWALRRVAARCAPSRIAHGAYLLRHFREFY